MPKCDFNKVALKKKGIKRYTVNPGIGSILVFQKRVGNSFSITFCVCFFKKNVPHILFY